MTIPRERTNAIQWAESFLMKLCDPKETPRVPKHIRREAAWILKHYPNWFDLKMAAKGSPDWFKEPMSMRESPMEYYKKKAQGG